MPVSAGDLRPGIIVRGPVFPEPVEILMVQPIGADVRLTGAGKSTEMRGVYVQRGKDRLEAARRLPAARTRDPLRRLDSSEAPTYPCPICSPLDTPQGLGRGYFVSGGWRGR